LIIIQIQMRINNQLVGASWA